MSTVLQLREHTSPHAFLWELRPRDSFRVLLTTPVYHLGVVAAQEYLRLHGGGTLQILNKAQKIVLEVPVTDGIDDQTEEAKE